MAEVLVAFAVGLVVGWLCVPCPVCIATHADYCAKPGRRG